MLPHDLAPEEQQTQIVNRHFPGILQRFDWQLPHAVDLADTGSIDLLATVGREAAAGMNWATILDPQPSAAKAANDASL